ncbi:MAG: hypothetical protein QXT25_00430 [Candidatus Anstonellaceae archaeon]
MKVILDTNFLLSHYEYGIDIYTGLLKLSSGPLELLLPFCVLNELSRLSVKKGRKGAAARFALGALWKIRQTFTFRLLLSEGKTDEWIIKYCSKNKDIFVASNDAKLIKKLKALQIVVLGIKGKSKVDFV